MKKTKRLKVGKSKVNTLTLTTAMLASTFASVFALTLPIYAEAADVGDYDSFKSSLTSGENINITADSIVIPEILSVLGKTSSLNLNGKMLSGEGDTSNSGIKFSNNSNLTLSGGGTISNLYNPDTTPNSVTGNEYGALNIGTGSTLNITGEDATYTFSSNTGGLGALNSTNGSVIANVNKIVFDGNISNTQGGGLRHDVSDAAYNSTVSRITAQEIVFNNNKIADAVVGSGAGAMNSRGTMELLGGENTFTNNQMNANVAANRQYKVGGGAVANQSGENAGTTFDATMTIGKADGSSTNTFSGNSSSTNGGAIMNRAVDDDGTATLTIIGATNKFENNTAALNGGAIYNVQRNDKVATINVTGTNNTFTGNKAGGLGGAIYNEGTMTISGTTNTFSDNYQNWNGATGEKNDIYNTGTLTITGNTSFDGGIAGNGAVNIDANVEIKDGANVNQDVVEVKTDRTMTVDNGATLTTNKLKGAGTLHNEGTVDVKLADSSDYTLNSLDDNATTKTGISKITVSSGTVNLNPTKFRQAKLETYGAGHLKLSGGDSTKGFETSVENHMTGSTLVIDTTIESLDNVAGAHASLQGNGAITNAINNEGTFDIEKTYTLTNGITDATTPTGTLNIGDTTGTNAYTVTLTSGQTITQNQVNILDKGTLIVDADGLTTPNAILNNGTLQLAGGTAINSTVDSGNATAATSTGKIVIDGFINQTAALTTTNTADDAITVNSDKYLKINADNLGANTTNAGTLDITGGTITNSIKGTGTTRIGDGSAAAYVSNTKTINQAVTVQNNGKFDNTTGGSVTGLLTISNGGTADISGGTTSGGVTNEGTLNIKGGNVSGKITQTTSTAALSVTNGSSLTVEANSNITAGSLTVGDNTTTGTLAVTGGNVTLGSDDSWSTKGTVNVTGGNLELAGVTQSGTLSQTAGALNITDNQTLGTGATVSGSKVTVASTKTLTLNTGSDITLDGDDGESGLTNVVWAGDIQLDGGKLTLNNIVDQSKVDTQTDPTTYNKTGKLIANTGNLIINSSNVLLGNSDVIKDAVNLTLASDITVATGAELNVTGSEWTTGKITLSGGTLGLNEVATSGTSKALIANTGSLTMLGATTTLGSSLDTIEKAVVVNIGSDLVINNTSSTGVILNGDTTTPPSADTWTKAITLAGGKLTLDNFTKSTDNTLKYNQTAGTLKLHDGASLTLNEGSKITGGNVNIDPSTLIFNNGVANSAVITMTDDGSILTVKGVDSSNITTLSMLDGSSISDAGTVTIGEGTVANILNMQGDTSGSTIAKEVTMVVNNSAVVNMTGTKAALAINTGDTWNGTINQTAGTLTVLNNNYTKNGILKSNGGTITIGDGTTASSLLVNNTSDDIATGTTVELKANSKLEQSNGNVVLDSGDSWAGIVNQTNGTLNIVGSNSKTGYLTSNGGNLNIGGTNVGTLNLNNSSDNITDSTVVTIADNGILNQTNGNVILDSALGTADTWTGAITLGGGTLELKDRTDSTSTTGTGTLTQTAGTLKIDNGSSLTVNSGSSIKGTSAVVLGEGTGNTTGTLVFNNTDNNVAQVTTIGTNTNTLTIGNGTGVTSLKLIGSSELAKKEVITIANNSTLEVNGTTMQGVNLNNGTSADTWNGKVNVTGGTLNISDNIEKAATGSLTQTSGNGTTNIVDTFTFGGNTNDAITAGTLNVGDSSGTNDTTLNVTGGTITSGNGKAKVVINSDATMNITGGTVTLDGGDDGAGHHSQVDWQGTVALGTGGTLILNHIYDSTRSAAELAGNTANKTGGKLNATGGDLTINANNVLLGANDIIADAVNVTLNTDNIYVGTGSTGNTTNVYIGTDDTWNGAINLTTSGTLTLDGTTTATGTNSVNATSGTLILDDTLTYGSGNGVTFGSTADKVAYDVATTVNADLNINAGQVQLDDNNDTLTSGKKLTVGGGQLDLTGISTANNQLVANTGTLNIQGSGKTTTLSNATGDLIAKAVATTIDAGSTLKINNDNANVTLDGTNDNWNGNLELNAGALTLDGRTDNLTGTTQTYSQDGGTLTLLDSSLTLANAVNKITGGSVGLKGSTTSSAGSKLTFDNGLTTNAAIITSDANTNNALTVGGTNGATLTLNSGSDINKDTAVTVTSNGVLNATGTSIKGGGSKNITNDGIFNLTNDGATAGTIARAINNNAGDGSTGTVNLTGITESTSDGTINQANVNVGDGTGVTDSSTFTMGANVTANTLLKVDKDGKIVNATKDIVAEQINVIAGASIVGDGTAEGNLTVKNGGTNAGTISQDNITLTAGTLHNTGSMTSNGTFTNAAASTVDNSGIEGVGTLNVYDGTNAGTITQGNMTIASGNNGFDNNKTITIETKLDNQGIFNNNKDVIVQNSTNNAELKNTGTLNSTANSTINADTLTNTGGTMNLTKSTVTVYYQSNDIKGIVNVLGTDASVDKTDLTITGTKPDFAGTMNVGDTTNPAIKSTLNLKSGNIIEEAVLNVASGNVLNIDDSTSGGTSSVVVDGTNDKYLGDITLASGDVEMKNLAVTTGATSTTSGGNIPYYAQTGGALKLTNSTLSMKNSSLISGGDLTVDTSSTFNSLSNSFTVDNLTNAGLVNAMNGGYENYAINSGLYVGDGIADNQGDFAVDLYARSSTEKLFDSFGSDSTTIYATNGTDGRLHISDWAIHGDLFGRGAPIDRYILFPNMINGKVAAGHKIDFSAVEKEVLTPIGNYRLMSLGGGNYALGLTSYNPAAYRGQVTTIAQYQNQLMIDDMIFNHTMLEQGFKGNDYLSSHPNYYASANDLYAPYQYSRKDGGLWVKMYGTFERLNMNRGLDVGNNAYGAVIGADFGLKNLRHGWQFMPTAYIAYNGAHQYWDGIGAYQNGGQIGFLGTWYKKNFMIGTMAYGGVYGNVMSTQRGNDNTFNYFAGASAKAAYNWRFAKNWALQPNLLVAYNYFGQQNWHTNFGQMSMMSGMLHGVNIAPGINLIWERETFSIYATLQYMYNINQSVGGSAGNVNLPRVHMDRGYIQYGLGINKRFTDRFSGYLQAVFRNVGRTGVSLQMGFQWLFGQKGNPIDKKTTVPKTEKTKINLTVNKA